MVAPTKPTHPETPAAPKTAVAPPKAKPVTHEWLVRDRWMPLVLTPGLYNDPFDSVALSHPYFANRASMAFLAKNSTTVSPSLTIPPKASGKKDVSDPEKKSSSGHRTSYADTLIADRRSNNSRPPADDASLEPTTTILLPAVTDDAPAVEIPGMMAAESQVSHPTLKLDLSLQPRSAPPPKPPPSAPAQPSLNEVAPPLAIPPSRPAPIRTPPLGSAPGDQSL